MIGWFTDGGVTRCTDGGAATNLAAPPAAAGALGIRAGAEKCGALAVGALICGELACPPLEWPPPLACPPLCWAAAGRAGKHTPAPKAVAYRRILAPVARREMRRVMSTLLPTRENREGCAACGPQWL